MTTRLKVPAYIVTGGRIPSHLGKPARELNFNGTPVYVRSSKQKDLTTQRFGHWTVLNQCYTPPGEGTWWRCRCDCGTVRDMRGVDLTWGNSRSCGCLTEEMVRESRNSRTPERVAQAKALREQGLSYGQIGLELGVTPPTARRWCNLEEDES